MSSLWSQSRGPGVSPSAARRPRTWTAALVAVVLAVALAPAALAQLPPDGLPARVVVIEPPVEEAAFATVDYGRKASAKDDRRGSTTWRVVHRTGNCCENYVTITPDGRLLDFGGTFINYTDDRGLNWRQVQPLTHLQNGEGAIVVAPGGDVLGVGWDPYTGDHLQSYKYEADTQQWLYAEMPLHQPFYDREWISVVPGPVTIDGQSHEYVAFIKGGWPYKEAWFYSTDGINYTDISSKAAEQILSGAATTGALPTAPRPLNDWAQANTNGRMTQLGGGHLLAGGDLLTSWSLFDGSSFSWSAYRLPDGSNPSGIFQVDSAGRLHNVVPASDGSTFDYRLSTDGGQTWTSTTVTLPSAHTIEEIDFRAHRAAGVAAVAIHAQNLATSTDQDLAYKLDIASDTPFVQRMYVVGLGDQDSEGGVGNSVRMDFQTVAIFADGRIALSFLDSTTNRRPALAIEQDTTLGRPSGGKPSNDGDQPPVLGEAYVSYSFDESDEGWATGGSGLWVRESPGASDGTDDPTGAGWAIWGPTYLNLISATVTSPPIATDAGRTVLDFWLKLDSEPGFDYLYAEWRTGTGTWQPIGQFAGRGDSYPGWEKVTLGFDSPGGDIEVRFRFESDELCSGAEPVFCGDVHNGVRVDEVTVGRQAP